MKKVKINNKLVNIPKLGLSHYKKLKDPTSPEESLKTIINDLFPDLTNTESLIALLHLMEFNGKIKSSFTENGITYTLNDVYILPKKSYVLDGKEYKFKQPDLFQKFAGPKDILESLSETNEDFGSLPAFVIKWADEITKTIAINLKDRVIYGDDILGLFE